MSDNLDERGPADGGERREENDGNFLNAIAMDFDPELTDGWLVWRITSAAYRNGMPTGETIAHEYTLHSSQCLDIANRLMRAAALAKGGLESPSEFELAG